MKKLIFLFSFFALSFAVIAQDDPKTLHQTARGFMAQADWDNAILVLNRLLQTDKNNLEYNKDMIQCYYFKRDFEKAVEGVKAIINRDDAVVTPLETIGDCLFIASKKAFAKALLLFSSPFIKLASLKSFSL